MIKGHLGTFDIIFIYNYKNNFFFLKLYFQVKLGNSFLNEKSMNYCDIYYYITYKYINFISKKLNILSINFHQI